MFFFVSKVVPAFPDTPRICYFLNVNFKLHITPHYHHEYSFPEIARPPALKLIPKLGLPKPDSNETFCLIFVISTIEFSIKNKGVSASVLLVFPKFSQLLPQFIHEKSKLNWPPFLFLLMLWTSTVSEWAFPNSFVHSHNISVYFTLVGTSCAISAYSSIISSFSFLPLLSSTFLNWLCASTTGFVTPWINAWAVDPLLNDWFILNSSWIPISFNCNLSSESLSLTSSIISRTI